MSAAYRAFERQRIPLWQWQTTTILLVSHDWNPARDGAESLAGRRLVAALLATGARVHVLASGRAQEEFNDSRYDVTVVERQPYTTNKAARAVQMIRSTIPESAGEWVPAAVQAGLRVVRTLPPDTIIYGRASPGASNIVAWHLARQTGLPYVAHFSDEWPSAHVFANGRRWLAPYKPPLFRLWRRRIVGDAGALTFTNPGQGEAVLGDLAARHAAKSFVVTHLPSQGSPRQVLPQYESFHIVHTGNFYPPGHTAAAAMQGLRLFLDRTPEAQGVVRFTQAGWANGDLPHWVTQCRLDDVVRLAGRLTEAEVVSLVDGASLLIAVDYARSDSRTMLSKLPDYINAARPILAIAAPSSSIGRLFTEDGAGLLANFDSPGDVAARISVVYQAWRRRDLAACLPQQTAVDSFTRARVLRELGAAFSTAVQTRDGRRLQRVEPAANEMTA